MIIANSKSVPIGFSAVYISICHFTLKGLRLLVRLLRGVLFAWCVLHFDQAAAQSIEQKGLPFITNYRYQDYNADGVNWWVEEDSHGVMYFANSVGILTFDGQHWGLIKPNGNLETRSLVKGLDGKIYVGTNGDLGFIDSDTKGKLQFVSLKDKLPEQHRTFGEVWEAQLIEGKVVFRTIYKIFEWDGTSFKIIESKEPFHVGGSVNGKYYCRIWNRGLCVQQGDSFHVVPNGGRFATERIYALLPYDNNRMLIGTRTQGLFIYDGKDFVPFKTEADPYIFNTSLYGGLVLSNGLIALNTFNDGMVIIDHQGKLIQRIDKSVGLQDNSVDNLFEDSRGNLWMPLFNGIAKIDLQSALTYYNEAQGLPAKTVFTIGFNNDFMYAGTNNGVFVLNKSTNRFEKVNGTSGQIGNFLINGKDLLVAGAEKGLLKLVGDKSYTLIQGTNYDFHIGGITRSKLDSTVLYCNLRSGMAIVRFNPSTSGYAVESFAKGFRSGSIVSETNGGNIWIAGDNPNELKLVIPQRKDGKVTLTESSVELYNFKQGLPVSPVSISEFDGVTYFIAGKDSIFVFDEAKRIFIQDTVSFLKNYIGSNIFNDGTLESSKDNLGRVWANFGTGVFVKIPLAGGGFKIVNTPFKGLTKNYPTWGIFHDRGVQVKQPAWFTGREGIIRYDGNLEETNSGSFKSIIRKILLNEDSTHFVGLEIPTAENILNHSWNTLQFEYAAPFFKQENETMFSTFLEGRDKTWSDWSIQSFREYGNLPSGSYNFRVKAKNIYDVESTESNYAFYILPAWYASWWAYLSYALLAGLVIYSLVRWRTYQLHEKHRELEKIVNSRTLELKLKADENAKLFDETAHLLSETKQRAAELSTVNNIGKALTSQLDSHDLIQMVGDQLKDLFRANIVYLALHDKDSDMLHFPYQYGENLPPLKFGEGLASKIIRSQEPILINKDFEASSELLGVKRLGIAASSYLGVPIPVGDEIIGVLSVQSTEQENRFNENDLRLLSTIASSVGVSLNNATLFDEVKQAKLAAEESGKMAERANEAKSAFLSTVSHELRTPLTSVLGFAKIIKKRLEEKIFPLTDQSDPKTTKTIQQVSENLGVVVSEGQRLTTLINDVLDLAKIEAGKMQWNEDAVSMQEVAETAIAATSSLFDQRSLVLIKDIDDSLPTIVGDKDKLIQVMVNLISNSVKFTPTGTVTCKVLAVQNEILVSIADTGIGIANKDHSVVFEQFKQVGDTLTDKPKGTGLGLPICKEIVEHHGGRIWLESELGKGSTFTFSIPTGKPSTPKPMLLDALLKQLNEEVARSQQYIKGKASNILIVDDDDSIRSLLQQELGDAGYFIHEARNGKEALTRVRDHRPDLIILDIMMPEMNGFDVAAVLKNDPATMDIPIIVLSIVEDKARGFRIGVDRYLNKPIDTNELFNEIGSLLDQGKSKKKVMIVDEDMATVNTLTEVLKAKGYVVMESDGKELVEKALANPPDIMIINSLMSTQKDSLHALRFEKGMENVLFLLYQ